MEKVECTTINVDCCHNDPVDIKCGGPYYLGFDFFVRRHEEQEMVKFIIATIEELHVPLDCEAIKKRQKELERSNAN